MSSDTTIPELKIIREVSDQAENFYNEAVTLGNLAADTLKERHRSQMTSLENIAESTFKTSDVLDYVKKQTARFSYWRQGDFGERLRKVLEENLAKRRDVICGEKGLDIPDMRERRRIHLLLMRQFIHHMVVHYEYQVNFGNKKKGER